MTNVMSKKENAFKLVWRRYQKAFLGEDEDKMSDKATLIQTMQVWKRVTSQCAKQRLQVEARKKQLGEPRAQGSNCWARLARGSYKEKGARPSREAELKRLMQFTQIMMMGGKEKCLQQLVQKIVDYYGRDMASLTRHHYAVWISVWKRRARN